MSPAKRFRLASLPAVLSAAAALLLSASALSFPPQSSVSRDADWLVHQLDATAWSAPYPSWKASHPSARCSEFHGDGSSLFIVDLWAYRCTMTFASGRVNRFFYILDPGDPPSSLLRQFQGEITQTAALPLSAMQRIHGEIESRLTLLYGKPETPESLPPGIAWFGSGDWQLLRVWRLGDRDIYLYLRQSPGRHVAVGLLARDRALQLASTAEGEHLLIDASPDAVFEDHIDSRLVTVLAKDVPGPAGLLGDFSDSPDSPDSPDADTQPKPETVYKAVIALLDRAAGATADRRAALLLAADRLAEQWQLPAAAKLPGDLETRIGHLASAAGAHFRWDPLGAAWVYQHDLLWTVWHEAPESEWGQDAFFLLLEHGWDTSGVCRAGADQFRTVIEQGRQFVGKFPESPARQPVEFLIAQAYETWWSLGEWSACSPVTDAGTAPCGHAPGSARYRAGSAAARAKAIEIYQSLLAADPQTYGTPALRRHLARLKLGIDTNQRRFYCLYD
jgi:hypothetical protein